MDPELALPSYWVFRGSLLALLVGSIFAVWLLVRPTDGSDLDAPRASIPVIPAGTATLEPEASATPTSTPAGVGAAQPPDETGTPTPTPTPVGEE